MRVAIVGSRGFLAPNLIDTWMDRLLARFGSDLTIVSGGARGPDSWAVLHAAKLGLPREHIVTHRAVWQSKDGVQDKTAGFRRNAVIVEDADLVIAFWNGTSKGTLDTMSKTVQAGKPLVVVSADGQVGSWKAGEPKPDWWKTPRTSH